MNDDSGNNSSYSSRLSFPNFKRVGRNCNRGARCMREGQKIENERRANSAKAARLGKVAHGLPQKNLPMAVGEEEASRAACRAGDCNHTWPVSLEYDLPPPQPTLF